MLALDSMLKRYVFLAADNLLSPGLGIYSTIRGIQAFVGSTNELPPTYRRPRKRLLFIMIRSRGWTLICKSWRRLYKLRARSCELLRKVSCLSIIDGALCVFTDFL